MNEKEFDYILIVLTYRNTFDLKDFFKFNNITNSKVIVVNSYYDENSYDILKKIAEENHADFISVPNNGYGAGNNRGIEYALSHYKFKYLIISNADIIIEEFSKPIIDNNKDYIIAPKILNLRGKNQNPSSAFKKIKIISNFTYYLYKNNHRKLIWLIYIYSRLSKILYYCISFAKKTIYSPHGAFFIIPYDILNKMIPLFNERMFLFYEENHLGLKADQLKIKIKYVPNIVIRHKEDGSVSFLSGNLFNYMKQSYMELYEYWKGISQ